MAWSGIAASLYPFGRTCHNAFKLEFPFIDDSNSNLVPSSVGGKLIEEANIIIWDEVPNASRHAMEVINDKLKEIMGNDLPFGGKIVVMGGDFRQIPPIVEKGLKIETINASVCFSPIWKEIEKFKLTENMRANADEVAFKEFLLQIGDGIYGEDPENIEIPSECISKGNIVEEIFGDIENSFDPANVMKRAILAPYNSEVDALNAQVLNLLGQETEKNYYAQDVYHYGDEILQNSGEICNHYKIKSIKGLPLFKLTLRKNAIIMLIRNLSIEDGLCNGTRLIVTKLLNHNLVTKKVNIDGSLSEDILIPRISLTVRHGAVEVTRHQFPVKLAFCLTIDKSQGQTFKKVGIVLNKPCFSHGQIYVAFSRVPSFDSLKVVLPEGESKTKNIVYKELLEKAKKE